MAPRDLHVVRGRRASTRRNSTRPIPVWCRQHADPPSVVAALAAERQIPGPRHEIDHIAFLAVVLRIMLRHLAAAVSVRAALSEGGIAHQRFYPLAILRLPA